MKNLNNVTLVCVTSVNIGGSIYALEKSCKNIKFNDVILFTDSDVSHDFIKIIKIPKLDYINYSEFIVYELHKHIETDFVLIVQNDGFIVNSEQWNDNFLNYDYIGAPFPIPDENDKISYRTPKNELVRVGNGGFSLRSKRLLSLPTELNLEWKSYFNYWNEDGFFCVHNREILETSGCVFAPISVAAQFSHVKETKETEGIIPFGFHGKNSKYINL